MHSPFTRLKRYRPDVVDQRENHATESLAACLQFSAELREMFVEFLFEGMGAPRPPAAELDVQTQQFVGEFGIPDLVLSHENGVRIVVEVKVGDHLRPQQAQKYGRWLSKGRKLQQYLFSLEKEQRHPFVIAVESKVPGERRTWRKLHEVLRRQERSFAGTTEGNLIAALCDYLEDESIVSTWKPSQILNLGPAIQAKAALEHCFARVAERLRESDKSFIAESKSPSKQWPRLEVGLPAWERIFGEGYQARVWAFYQVEGVWGSNINQFYFCFFIWNGNFPSDWGIVAKKLPVWAKTLHAQGFEFSVNLGRRNELSDVLEVKALKEQPKTFEVWFRDEKCSHLKADRIRAMSDDELVNELATRLQELCRVVSKLA